jgi:hypothetical protein
VTEECNSIRQVPGEMNMQKTSTRKAVTRSPADFSPSRDEIVGVANLLVLARSSVESNYPDKICIDLLDQCISHLTTRYGVSRSKLSGGRGAHGSAELPALLRVLQYAQADAMQSLNDSGCADLLSQCIRRLSHNQLLEDRATPPAFSIH